MRNITHSERRADRPLARIALAIGVVAFIAAAVPATAFADDHWRHDRDRHGHGHWHGGGGVVVGVSPGVVYAPPPMVYAPPPPPPVIGFGLDLRVR